MIAIGIYAARRTKSHEDYVLGGRSLHPATAALSAGASDMSGWLLMGLPGAIYAAGLIESWIAIGLTIGAWLNWKFVAPRLRAYTEVSRDSITIPSYFENRLRDSSHILRIVSAVIIIIFFTLYISSGMVAGGKFYVTAFQGSGAFTMFDNPYLTGVILVGGVTLIYTLIGGFLAATLTDVVQGVLIMLALIAVPIIGIVALGGPAAVFEGVEQIDPSRLGLFGNGDINGALILGIVSSMAWGLGYFGQPHIITRFMALKTPKDATLARRIGIGWMIVSLVGAVVSAFVGIAYIAQNGVDLQDPEKVVLVMSQLLFHPLIAGFVLSAVLAAIMSTLSSQLIVTSAAFVEDLFRLANRTAKPGLLKMLGRGIVLLVAVVAMLLASDPESSVLGLVSFAWGGFGASFGPIIILSLFWKKLTNWGALAGMVVGAVTIFLWKNASGGLFDLYELLPAFILAAIAAVVVSLVTYRQHDEIDREFTQTGRIVLGEETLESLRAERDGGATAADVAK